MLKEEASSPLVATESLLLSRLINRKENCGTMILGILNAFTQPDMLENFDVKQTILSVHGVIVNALYQITLEAGKDFTTHNNKDNRILCTSMLKLLHGMLKTPILCC